MTNLDQILALTKEKYSYLNSYEILSSKLVQCDFESMNDLLDRRESIIRLINNLDKNIQKRIEVDEQSITLLGIIRRNLTKDELIETYLVLYEVIESIYDVLSNIQELEKIVLKQIDRYKDELYTNIKQTNNVTKIQKYFATYETEIDDIALMISKSSKA